MRLNAYARVKEKETIKKREREKARKRANICKAARSNLLLRLLFNETVDLFNYYFNNYLNSEKKYLH